MQIVHDHGQGRVRGGLPQPGAERPVQPEPSDGRRVVPPGEPLRHAPAGRVALFPLAVAGLLEQGAERGGVGGGVRWASAPSASTQAQAEGAPSNSGQRPTTTVQPCSRNRRWYRPSRADLPAPASPVTRTTPPPRRASRATCSRARSSSSRPTNRSSSGRTTPTGSPTPPSGTPPSDADAQLPCVDRSVATGSMAPGIAVLAGTATRHAQELGAPRQHGPLQLGQGAAETQAEFVGQHTGRPPQFGDRVGAASTGPQPEGQQPPAFLPQRMLPYECLGRRHRLPRGSRGEGRGDRHLPCRQVQFIQPGGLGRRPLLVRALAVRRSVPPPERLLEQAPGLCPRCRACPPYRRLEPPGVDRVLGQPQRVPGRGTDQDAGRGTGRSPGFERTPQVGHVDVQRGRRLLRGRPATGGR